MLFNICTYCAHKGEWGDPAICWELTECSVQRVTLLQTALLGYSSDK